MGEQQCDENWTAQEKELMRKREEVEKKAVYGFKYTVSTHLNCVIWKRALVFTVR